MFELNLTRHVRKNIESTKNRHVQSAGPRPMAFCEVTEKVTQLNGTPLAPPHHQLPPPLPPLPLMAQLPAPPPAAANVATGKEETAAWEDTLDLDDYNTCFQNIF